MITRFEVDGFKSLQEFVVDLEPLTIFVGPNGTGKSNLLEALALLGRLASMSVEEAFQKGRGRVLDQFSRARGETSRTIRFAVEVHPSEPIMAFEEGGPRPQTRFRYELASRRRRRISAPPHPSNRFVTNTFLTRSRKSSPHSAFSTSTSPASANPPRG